VKTKEAEAATVGKGALLGSDEEEDNGECLLLNSRK
jgi:hypothetical protein